MKDQLIELNLQTFAEGEEPRVNPLALDDAAFESYMAAKGMDSDGNPLATVPQVEEMEASEPAVDTAMQAPESQPAQPIQSNQAVQEPTKSPVDIEVLLSGIGDKFKQAMAEMGNNKMQEAPKQEVKLTQEELEAMSEKDFEDLAKNPREFISNLLSEFGKSKDEEIRALRERLDRRDRDEEAAEEFEEFKERYSDADPQQLLDFLKSNPSLAKDKGAFEKAYKLMKFDELHQNASKAPKSADDIIANEELMKQMLENPDVQKRFEQKLASKVAEKAKEVPPSLGGEKDSLAQAISEKTTGPQGWDKVSKNVMRMFENRQ